MFNYNSQSKKHCNTVYAPHTNIHIVLWTYSHIQPKSKNRKVRSFLSLGSRRFSPDGGNEFTGLCEQHPCSISHLFIITVHGKTLAVKQ